jgi:glutamate synthase domain-containing protein 3
MPRASGERRSVVEAAGKSAREINRALRELVAAGESQITVRGAVAQHNLAVGILTPVSIAFLGSVGYYCGGLMDGPALDIEGSAGWGLGESMMSGSIRVRGSAGNSCAASMRGGTVVVDGSAGARAGISMKGGILLVRGDCGPMTGFMMQKGAIVVCGDAAPGLGDSMYEGTVFVAGEIAELGNDAVIRELGDADREFLEGLASRSSLPAGRSFRKVVAGRRLWNFDKREIHLWREVL